MITEKDIQSRLAEILSDAGFNVVASEVKEGFSKPAVFISVLPSSVTLQTCGGATEEVTDSVELKYISALETDEDCIDAAWRFKKLFLYQPFDIADRHITIQTIEFDIENSVLYVYFDIEFTQAVDRGIEYDDMSELILTGGI